MPNTTYRAKQDVAFPRVISKISGEGKEAQYETEGVNYPAGSFIKAEHLTPRDQERAESGELDHLIEPVGDDEHVFGYGDHENEFGIFVAEHEAEAHALEQYGHHVIPKEQEMEALSRGAEHAAEYQQAVKDAGLDRRRNQEVMAESRQRVPDHVLYGAETRTGTPHHRGEQGEEQYEEDESGSESEEQAPRPRPGAGSEQSLEEARAEQGADQGPGDPVE